MRLKYLLFILFSIGLWGCSKSAYKQSVKVYRKSAKVLKTRGVTDNVFHRVASQIEIAPAFDGIMLCFEDIPRKRVSSKPFNMKNICATYNLSTKAFDSHSMRFQGEKSLAVLRGKNVQALTHSVTAVKSAKYISYNVYNKKDAFEADYNLYSDTKAQLDRTTDFLESRLKAEQGKPYTHIVLMSTGWNNDQQKSVFHYNAWLNNIDSAAKTEGGKFNPLYVCITWPSYYRNFISYLTNESFVPYSGVDFFENQKDADQLGMTHINYLLWKILVPLSSAYNKPLVLLGHSFGARMLTRASYSSPLFLDNVEATDKLDVLMSFQGAYKLRRHLPVRSFMSNKRDDGLYTLSDPVKRFVATVSKNDCPMNIGALVTWDRFMGDEKIIKQIKSNGYNQFSIGSVSSSGDMAGDERAKLLVLECTDAIQGHHDVTNEAMGKLIWELIKKSDN